MGFGEPKMPTPEEMAKMQKERALSDAELIKGGADYAIDKNGNLKLNVTDEQIEQAKEEMGDNKLKEKMKDLTDKDRFFISAMASHDELLHLIEGRTEDVKLKSNLREALGSIFSNLHDLYRFKPGEGHEDKNSIDLENIGFEIQKKKANALIKKGVWSAEKYGKNPF